MIRILCLLLLAALLILIILFPFSIKKSKKEIPKQRFKRSQPTPSEDCPIVEGEEVDHLIVLGALNIIYRDEYGDSIKKNFPTFRKPSSLSSHLSADELRFFKRFNNQPAFSFSLNIPSFECLHQSSFSAFFEEIECLFKRLRKTKHRTFYLTEISKKSLPILLSHLANLISLLNKMDGLFSVDINLLTFNSSLCPFIARCRIHVKPANATNYTVIFNIAELSEPTKYLSPRPEPFSNGLKPLHSIIKYTEIDEHVMESVSSFENITKESLKFSASEAIKVMNSLLVSRIPTIDDSFDYIALTQIPLIENAIIESLKIFTFSERSLHEQIELGTFVICMQEFPDVANIETSSIFLKESVAVSRVTRWNAAIYSHDVRTYQNDYEELYLPSFAHATQHLYDLFLTESEDDRVKNRKILEERRLRMQFSRAFINFQLAVTRMVRQYEE